jgi:hypothetical protein
MTFDVTGLLIFLLAIVPGFLAQQSRHSIVPRSLKAKSAIEETGEYVINSLIVHLVLLVAFRIALAWRNPQILATLVQSIADKTLGEWLLGNRYLVFAYFVVSLAGGFILGFVRAVLALNQYMRNWLTRTTWFSAILRMFNIHSFLLEDPVWYGVFRQRVVGEFTFVQVKLKGGGYYAGELHSYGIVDDSEREKDFYLINTFFRNAGESPNAYRKIDADGVLLNFSDVDAIEVTKVPKADQ